MLYTFASKLTVAALHDALLDSTGNLIESYDSEDEARTELEQILANEPEAAGDVALIAYDEKTNR